VRDLYDKLSLESGFSFIVWWILTRLGEAVFVALTMAGGFSQMRISQKREFKKLQSKKESFSLLREKNNKNQKIAFLKIHRHLKNINLIASVPLWIAATEDPLGTKEDVIEFFVNGPKRYRRFRQKFFELIYELYEMNIEMEGNGSSEKEVLKLFLKRLEAVKVSQFGNLLK